MTLSEAEEWFKSMLDATVRRAGEVRLEGSAEVATICIDNPAARNAMHLGMMLDLCRIVQILALNPPGVVFLRASRPGVFCAGGHLGDVRSSLADPEAGRQMSMAMSVVLNSLADLPSLVVCIVEGACIGGGAELATAADVRLMTSDAYLDFVQGRLGVVAGWGGAGRLMAICGRGNAIRALAGGERLGGLTCELLGLGVPVDDDELARWIAHLTTLAPKVARAMKKQFNAGLSVHDSDRVVWESNAFAEVWAGPAHRKALSALPK